MTTYLRSVNPDWSVKIHVHVLLLTEGNLLKTLTLVCQAADMEVTEHIVSIIFHSTFSMKSLAVSYLPRTIIIFPINRYII